MTLELCYIIVGMLLVFAVFDLMVGVSNDAVNFLNSAIGSKAAPFFVIMIIASLGILAGVTFSGGMMEVQPHVVTVLADTSIRAENLDEAKAEEAKRAAEEAIANRRGVMEIAEAQAELAQAVAQLAAIKKLRQLR